VILPREDDITKIHALITGPFDTPYEGGFFHFYIRCPADYPLSPPLVRFMTTGGGVVRFNPNLYVDGKVCISILGTTAGPGWSPSSSISALLISIQYAAEYYAGYVCLSSHYIAREVYWVCIGYTYWCAVLGGTA
jgi:ubiquitin-conjugating enzyme E2 Z